MELVSFSLGYLYETIQPNPYRADDEYNYKKKPF